MIDTYYFDAQIRRYLVQFMAVFSGIQVRTGKGADGKISSISVPVMYGSRDRVVAAEKSAFTQNKMIRLPLAAAYLKRVQLDPNLRKGVGVDRDVSYIPSDASTIYNVISVNQLMPIPYRAHMELTFATTNTMQQHQILEQIMMLFDPIIQIQRSDSAIDWTKIATVELTDIGFEEEYPLGQSRRLVTTTMAFNFPFYIAPPQNYKNDYIKQINFRISEIDLNAFQTVEQAIDFGDPAPIA